MSSATALGGAASRPPVSHAAASSAAQTNPLATALGCRMSPLLAVARRLRTQRTLRHQSSGLGAEEGQRASVPMTLSPSLAAGADKRLTRPTQTHVPVGSTGVRLTTTAPRVCRRAHPHRSRHMSALPDPKSPLAPVSTMLTVDERLRVDAAGA